MDDKTFYTAVVFIACFVMLSLIIAVFFNPLITKKHKVRFSMLFLTLVLLIFFEWLADVVPVKALIIVSKYIEYSLAPMVPVFATLALGGQKKLRYALYGLAGLNFILETVSIPTGIIFTVEVNPDTITEAIGPAYGLYVAILILSFSCFAIFGFMFSARYQFRNVAFLVCMSIVIEFGIISNAIPAFYDNLINLDWISVSFATMLLYIYYGELVHQIDSLTGLLNRSGFECHLQKLKQPVWIIFFDVDRFKSINDVYGHIYGDECLKLIAENVQEFFGEYGYCFRYGGDEFCAILARDDLDLRTLIIAYENKLADLRKNDDRLPGISAGFTRFDPAVEAYDEAISRADGNMYDEKLKHHQAMDEAAKKNSTEKQ